MPEVLDNVVVEQAAPSTGVSTKSEELTTARKRLLTALLSHKSGGGSDLVGRSLRASQALGGIGQLGNKRNQFAVRAATEVFTINEVIEFCTNVDGEQLKAWALNYISGLKESKARDARFDAFCKFIDAGGFASIALALQTIVRYSSYTFSEVYTDKNGKSIKYMVDVAREINDMFGIKLTASRRAKNAVLISE